MPTFYEFFAGGGMARAGLGPNWTCLFANDFDLRKALSYQSNWGSDELRTGDVKQVLASDLPGTADLAWASFPCQDLSLAGVGAGLKGERSGAFWPFWNIISALVAGGRAPRIIALENVCGTLTSHGGEDFRSICSAFASTGYHYGAIVIDARLFVPHSRPRLFIVGVRDGLQAVDSLTAPGPIDLLHTSALRNAVRLLGKAEAKQWIWWNLPAPPKRITTFADLVEEEPTDVKWHSGDETAQLLSLMSPTNLAKVEAVKLAQRRIVGCIYKRTRVEAGERTQRAEVRFDDMAGCLRTPVGGSSRQLIMVVDGPRVRSRLISSRETARLMGLPDDYSLPASYNEAYHLTGDGVAVPVVSYIARQLFEPVLQRSAAGQVAA